MAKLKHLLFLGFLCLISFGSYSQTVKLLTTDGQTYSFDSVEKIVFTRDNIVFENSDGEDNYHSVFFTEKMFFDQTATAVTINEYQSNISIYPNPASTELRISRPRTSSNTVAQLYNISGMLLKQIQLNEQQNVVDVSELTPGIYFISVDSETLKFIKQ